GLLIDNVRDPNVSFQSALSYLSADPRFSAVTQATAMTQARLQAIFTEHMSHIQSKGSSALSTLFESYAPGLNIRWDDLSSATKNSLGSSGVAKQMRIDAKISLGSSRRKDRRSSTSKHDKDLSDTDEERDTERFEYPALRQEFERWQRQRFADARAAFDVMLSENAFVEFWGRVRKMGVTDDTEKQKLEKLVFSDEGPSGAAAVPTEEDPGEGEGGGGRADLQSLAKAVDVKEVERVLKGDKRYIVFDYMPEQRHQWVTVSSFPPQIYVVTEHLGRITYKTSALLRLPFILDRIRR
ncbi:12035_t:CDS:1, partial [Acaulospora colombiana]